MLNKDTVSIPDIEILEKIIDNTNGYIINKNLNPNNRFEVYNEKKQSKFLCTMTADHALFSIDIINVKDEILIKMLENVLRQYNLETDNLIEDISRCFARKNEFQTDYDRFWVIYRYHKESDRVLVRYRAHVED
jgi:hypothetical protein